MDTYDAYTLVKRFQQLHEERAHTYHLFNEGHKLLLCTAPDYNFDRFQQLVTDTTQEFKRISETVGKIEKGLRVKCAQIILADLIASIQDEEKSKLELTACLQLAKQGCIDYPDQPEREVEVELVKQRLNHVIDRINLHLEEVRYEAADL